MQPDDTVTLGDWLSLREEMQAAEALLAEMQFEPQDLPAYWSMSADLLALLQEIDEHLEQWRQQGPGADERVAYLALRKRLNALLARSEEIGVELDAGEEEPD